jgi:Domain of unknown function (DUF4145)
MIGDQKGKPSMPIQSRNFGFLTEHDPLLTTCGARAECYVFDDPNTSLVKTRQFGELLARHVAARFGFDARGMEFGSVLRTLSENRFIPGKTREVFDVLRLQGNEAIHEHSGDRQSALTSLVAAYHLALWFQRTFVDQSFAPGPYRPPTTPKQAHASLREELEALKIAVTRYEQELAVSQGKAATLEEIARKLEREAGEFEEAKRALVQAADDKARERDEFERELNRVRQNIPPPTPADSNAFIERARHAEQSLGASGTEDHVPLARIRIRAPSPSSCHNAPVLLAQSSSGGFVACYCVECAARFKLSRRDFIALDLWISCPRCSNERMRPCIVHHNYGYTCLKCNLTCLLVSLLPRVEDLFR